MAHWNHSYKPARFFTLDARIMVLIVPTLLHFRYYTVLPVLAVAAILYYVERRMEMSVSSAGRAVRSFLAGRIRPGRVQSKQRQPIDFDRVG